MSNIKKKDGWARVVNGQPKIGQFSERSRTTKISDIHAFTEMTGDKNPVHYDDELAKKQDRSVPRTQQRFKSLDIRSSAGVGRRAWQGHRA